MILNKEEKIKFLKNNFHEYFDITISSNITEENINNFVNIVIPLSTLNNFYNIDSEIGDLFNNNFNNVIFTPSENEDVIYKYEIYEKVFFIRMFPFSHNIRMHIIPKEYDASNTRNNPILFFKENNETIDENIFECSEEYTRYDYENTRPINLYYMESTKLQSDGIYKFDIKEQAKDLDKIQINAGYSYNTTNPTNEINHYIGILDLSDENGEPISTLTEWNLSLMAANYDNISNFTNVVKMQELEDDQIIWPTNSIPYPDNTVGFNNPHNFEQVYHKTIKYFNDDIYTEENGEFIVADWNESIGQ